jgi:hypothetical protein
VTDSHIRRKVEEALFMIDLYRGSIVPMVRTVFLVLLALVSLPGHGT